MQLKALFDDDQAVSPVIGVILMVAITVILAAVIGTFVLGLGDRIQTQSPQVTWSFDTASSGTCIVSDGDTFVSITHGGGDAVQASNLDLMDGTGGSEPAGDCGFSSEITAGSSGSVETTSGETLRITWSSPDSDKSSVIGSYQVP